MYLCLGEVTSPSINSTFEKVDLGEDHLIVEFLELRQKCINSSQGGLELQRFYEIVYKRELGDASGLLIFQCSQWDEANF